MPLSLIMFFKCSNFQNPSPVLPKSVPVVYCCCSVAKSCPTLCGPMDCNPPRSSVHGVSQEWVAISFSRGSAQPRDWTQVSCIAGGFFTAEPPGKPCICAYMCIFCNVKLHVMCCSKLLFLKREMMEGKWWFMRMVCSRSVHLSFYQASLFNTAMSLLLLLLLSRFSRGWLCATP